MYLIITKQKKKTMETRNHKQESIPEVPLLLSLEEGQYAAQCLLKKIGYQYSRLTKGK